MSENIYESKHKGVQGTMDVGELYIQDGDVYEVSAQETVAQSTGWSLVHITPNTDMHLEFSIRTIAGSGLVKLYRNPVLSSTAGASTGTALNAWSHNDNGAAAAGAKFTLTPLISSTGGAKNHGTELMSRYIPGSGFTGASVKAHEKWILAKANTYSLFFQPTTDGTKMGWSVMFHEV